MRQPPDPRDAWTYAASLAGGQKALAQRLGVHKSQVNRYINGEQTASLATALKLEKMLGIPRRMIRPDLFVMDADWSEVDTSTCLPSADLAPIHQGSGGEGESRIGEGVPEAEWIHPRRLRP